MRSSGGIEEGQGPQAQERELVLRPEDDGEPAALLAGRRGLAQRLLVLRDGHALRVPDLAVKKGVKGFETIKISYYK